MKLSDEQIKILLDKFVISEYSKSWREQRLNDHKRWKEWIDQEAMVLEDIVSMQYTETE